MRLCSHQDQGSFLLGLDAIYTTQADRAGSKQGEVVTAGRGGTMVVAGNDQDEGVSQGTICSPIHSSLRIQLPSQPIMLLYAIRTQQLHQLTPSLIEAVRNLGIDLW